MQSKETLVASLVLGALLFIAGARVQAKGPGGHSNNHRGGQADAHRSTAGSANSNAQWSADPTRGWVRAEERSELRKHGTASSGSSAKGKPQAKAKTKGY